MEYVQNETFSGVFGEVRTPVCMAVYELTSFQRDLLFVAGGLTSASGKEIKNELEESQGRKLLAGRVYTNLDTLVDEELVEKGEIDGRTNRYVITENGEDAIEQLYEWQRQHADPQRI